MIIFSKVLKIRKETTVLPAAWMRVKLYSRTLFLENLIIMLDWGGAGLLNLAVPVTVLPLLPSVIVTKSALVETHSYTDLMEHLSMLPILRTKTKLQFYVTKKAIPELYRPFSYERNCIWESTNLAEIIHLTFHIIVKVFPSFFFPFLF